MKRILGIGNALVDIMTLIDNDSILEELALPKGSMQLVDAGRSADIKAATEYFPGTRASGGSAANTIHGLAMLGAETGFSGSIGNDSTGDFFENDLIKAGVKTNLKRRNTHSGTSVILVSKDTERTFATHLGAAVELDAADLDPLEFRNYDILYLEGYLINNFLFTETACKIARESGMSIALDLASYNVVEEHLPSFREITEKYVDILFANEQEALKFTGYPPEKALALLSELCRIAVLKTGSEGSLIKSGNELVRINAVKANCIDTTGAGDLYAAGFLYGFASELDLPACGAIGSLMAGRVIEVVGARMDSTRFLSLKKEVGKLSARKET
ncbi:MAG TPA: adenosine kinase [Bacteroidales bacterium]|nr:adenosine kinase [Bacteroidales bacterium]